MKKRSKKNVIITFKMKMRQKLVSLLVVVLVLLVLVFFLMAIFVNPIIKKTGVSKISQSAGEGISLAINEAMKGTVTYDDLIHIVTDSSGKITMLQANSIQINALSRKVIECAYNELLLDLSGPLEIPLGNFSGFPIFSGVGPIVYIASEPYLNVTCNFLSKFIQAGINQTVHQIYLSVVADVTMIMPFTEINSKEKTEVLISESLIIGEIPQTYLMAEEKSDLLNMVG